MNNEQVLKLYASCLPVQGARRSIICDLQNGSFKFIPNALYELLTRHSGKTILSIKEYYGHEHDGRIDDYIQFLTDNDFAFFCDRAEVDNYPDLCLDWERPELITNVILDIDPDKMYDLGKVSEEIAVVNCKALQIRIFRVVSLDTIRGILDHFGFGPLQHIEILTGYHEDFTEEVVSRLAGDYLRLNVVIFHGSPEDRVLPLRTRLMNVVYTKRVVGSADHCGVINPAFFDVTPGAFMESKQFNSCLNRKIGVDVKGRICNCPSMPQRYGHISDTGFLEAIQSEGFEIPGKIRKDEIQICKSCEFRYICTDCRAFVVDPADMLSKPAKCRYDPFLAHWDERSG